VISRALAALGFAALAGCATPVPPVGPLDASVSGALELRATDRLTLSGTLAFPAAAAPVPAVVLMHGCNGIGASVRGWERELRRWGYATFVVDSLRGRGLREVCVGGGLASEERTGDAYAALVVLATHPRIAATRIALMGFSHGGGTALVAAIPSVAAGHVPAGGPRFRAFIAFYPSCRRQLPGAPVAAPLRVHIGGLDDWTPARPCEELAVLLAGRGADVGIVVYPDAHHGFDAVGGVAYRYLADVRSPRGRGASVGYSPDATRAARVNVRAELAALLK